MRISDWSSDVCSSDLIARQCIPVDEHSLGDREGERRIRVAIDAAQRIGCYRQRARGDGERGRIGRILREADTVTAAVAGQPPARHPTDPTSVVSDKSVSVRLALGGRRITRKTQHITARKRQSTYNTEYQTK